MPDTPYENIYTAFLPENIARDLVAVIAWLALALAFVFLPVLSEMPFRVVFALPVVLFLPGYALIAALFPEKNAIDGIERIALSFGLSIAVVPLLGLALNYTPWGIRLVPVAIAVSLFTVVLALVAQYRRGSLPPEERFFIPARAMAASVRAELFPAEGQPRLDRVLSVLLVVSIVAALATTVYVIAVPKEGEKFTEFYILGPGGMAADYPDRFPAGEEQLLIVGIGNREYRGITYTVETFLLDQRFDTETNESAVYGVLPLETFTVTVPHNTTVEQNYTFSVPAARWNRLEFVLFNETVPAAGVPAEERIAAAYRDLHLWFRVRE
ncbi:MAG: DUF1616 domain-containing protein [Methanomicrobiaceae archaeon]|nr:DUF1616 domain-containing protein [Methanomicrobiaceae archaeon]